MKPEINEIFGKRLRKARNHIKISQKELGRRLYSDSQMISIYERGLNAPSIIRLDELSKELDVSVEWLLGKTDERGKYVESHE